MYITLTILLFTFPFHTQPNVVHSASIFCLRDFHTGDILTYRILPPFLLLDVSFE